MFYIRLAVCRYVGLLSGQMKSVEKLELSDLDETRIRSAERRDSNPVHREKLSDTSIEADEGNSIGCKSFQSCPTSPR